MVIEDIQEFPDTPKYHTFLIKIFPLYPQKGMVAFQSQILVGSYEIPNFPYFPRKSQTVLTETPLQQPLVLRLPGRSGPPLLDGFLQGGPPDVARRLRDIRMGFLT